MIGRRLSISILTTLLVRCGVAQRTRLGEFGEIVAVDIHTIEDIGGGSARCMIAEIFYTPGETP